MLPARIIGTVVSASGCQPFTLDTPSGNVTTGKYQDPDRDQGLLGSDEKKAVQRQVKAQLGEAREVRVGEYRCPKCDRWVDVSKGRGWSGDKCDRCG